MFPEILALFSTQSHNPNAQFYIDHPTAIDVGGVRRQVYTTVYNALLSGSTEQNIRPDIFECRDVEDGIHSVKPLNIDNYNQEISDTLKSFGLFLGLTSTSTDFQLPNNLENGFYEKVYKARRLLLTNATPDGIINPHSILESLKHLAKNEKNTLIAIILDFNQASSDQMQSTDAQCYLGSLDQDELIDTAIQIVAPYAEIAHGLSQRLGADKKIVSKKFEKFSSSIVENKSLKESLKDNPAKILLKVYADNIDLKKKIKTLLWNTISSMSDSELTSFCGSATGANTLHGKKRIKIVVQPLSHSHNISFNTCSRSVEINLSILEGIISNNTEVTPLDLKAMLCPGVSLQNDTFNDK